MTKVLVVGQTPPPLHGQAVMIDKMLQGDYGGIELRHVPMAFSQDIDQVGRFRPRKVLELLRVICRILAGRFVHKADILYYPPAGPDIVPVLRDLAILIATRWAFHKTVFHFHAGGVTDLYDNLPPAMRFLFRLAYAHPDLAIRTSEHAPQDGERLGARQERVVPNGVEDECGPGKDNRPAGTGTAHVLFVGALRESKGLHVLLEACNILSQKGVPFHLDLMGEFLSSQSEQAVRDYVGEHGLAQVVTFLGMRTGAAKHAAFAEADVFCFPTYYPAETFGLVIAEAMSCGLPVVATDWRGIPDIVEDGISGFLVPIKDAPAVADKLELLIRDPILRRGMGEQGRKRYLEQFTIERFRARMKEALELVATS